MANFKAAVRWIAENDETAETEVAELEALVSVALVADVWGKSPHVVALEVLRERAKMERAERAAAEYTRVTGRNRNPSAVSL